LTYASDGREVERVNDQYFIKGTTDLWSGEVFNGLNYAADESWGPKIDGTTQYRPWWSWYPGEDFGQTIPLTANPNNIRDFFDTGITYNNNVSFRLFRFKEELGITPVCWILE
ncbi:MAG: hypothetical protein AAFP02_10190, partial [Bacteroidota bacterium]